jgi:AcrR family transcriptional regulator
MAERHDRPVAGMRRAAGVARTRSSIVAAGRQHLIDRGYHRLSLEEVAAAAAITRITIYRQFGSKLGLLEAIADDVAERSLVVPRVAAAAAMPDPSDAFRALIRELCHFWATDPDLFRRLVSLSAVDPSAQQIIDVKEDWRYDQVRAAVNRMAAEGRLRLPFNSRLAGAVIGAMTSFPACDDMATRLHMPLTDLDELLLALIATVVDLGLFPAETGKLAGHGDSRHGPFGGKRTERSPGLPAARPLPEDPCAPVGRSRATALGGRGPGGAGRRPPLGDSNPAVEHPHEPSAVQALPPLGIGRGAGLDLRVRCSAIGCRHARGHFRVWLRAAVCGPDARHGGHSLRGLL